MTLLADTITCAENFLSSEADIDTRITQLTVYTEAFNGLFKAIQEKSISPPLTADDLQPIAELHQRVLAQAVSLLGDTSGELRQLQSRGKAILAYTDTLPKRVSIRGKKRG